jgi:molybdopterin-containing oxidoreductase family iron-sulfur binding subunit
LITIFSKASLIVSVGADFGDWQGGGFDAGYAKGRIPKAGRCLVIFNEANMTLSGAAADKRLQCLLQIKQALFTYIIL